MTKDAVDNQSFTLGTSKKFRNGTLLDSTRNYVTSPRPRQVEQTTKALLHLKHQTEVKESSTLRDEQVPEFLREPFITSGYRDSDNFTVRQCLATLLTVHNETFNIWSHLIAFLAFLSWSIAQISKHDIIGNSTVYPLLSFMVGNSLVLLSSSFAHLFSCISWKARHACFYIDYASISIFTLTAGQGYIFYSRPVTNDSLFLYRFPYIFLAISFCFSCTNMVLNCLSRHRHKKYRFLIRTGVYAVKFIYDISPFMARCFLHGSTCNANTVYLFKRQMFWYAIGGIVNASRLPERLSPGFFDLFGHSHHIFHVFLVFGNFDAFNVMFHDMIDRKEILSASPYPPTFFTTFGLLILLTLANTLILIWFVRTWLTAEEEELFSGSKYLVYKNQSNNNSKNRIGKINNNFLNNEVIKKKKM